MRGMEPAEGEDRSLGLPPTTTTPPPGVKSCPPLCSQAENCPFLHGAQTEALHLLHHPSAAQHNLQPPATDLTLVLFPPAAAATRCSGLSLHLLKMKIRVTRVTIRQRRRLISLYLISQILHINKVSALLLNAWRISEDAFVDV